MRLGRSYEEKDGIVCVNTLKLNRAESRRKHRGHNNKKTTLGRCEY